ncbi:PKD domain-containing protein [Lentzea sp. NPDC054927]
MKRLTRQAVIAMTAVAAAVAAVLVAGPGYDAARVRMHSGAIWLSSVHTGQVTLVDGATAEVKARVTVAEPGTAFSVVQQDGNAYALNQTTGQLSRVDSATEQVSRPSSVIPPSDRLTVKPARDGLHVVDLHSGTTVSVDLKTLTPQGEPRRLGDALRPDSVAMDGNGRLWAADEKGDLVWLAGGDWRTSPAAVRNGRLAITENQPAVVDPERGTVDLLSPDSGAVVKSLRTDLRADDDVAVTGSADQPRVLITNSTRGELITCTFGTGTCVSPVRVGAPGADLGAALEIGNHAIIPDRSTGQATVVDLATARVVAQHELFPQPTRFELLAHDGFVFFNDPNGNVAGVLDLSGDVRTVIKYAEGPTLADTPPAPDPRALTNQTPQTGHPGQKPALGIPRNTVQPVTNIPAPPPPASGASIAVSPDHHGVVGEEFELTIVVQSPTSDWDTQWTLGDGSARSGPTIRHSWQQPGVFTIRATATFPTGARVLAETVVTVDPPEAPPRITALNVHRPKPVVGETVHFSADSTAPPDSWAWTVSRPGSAAPEAISRTPEFDHSFSAQGTYVVTLTITRGTLAASSTRQFTVAQGAVKGWGREFEGLTTPPPSAGSGVVAISGGADHALALKANGSVIAWGNGDLGQTTLPPRAEEGVIAISAGRSHSLALKKDGSVIAWGDNSTGQLLVPSSAEHDVVAIAAGYFHNVALKKDGSVIAWGDGDDGQTTVPPAAMSGVIAISAGASHSLALKSDGSVVHWGYVEPGVPRVPPEAMSGVVMISVGSSYSLAVKSDGSVIGWSSVVRNRTEVVPPPEEVLSGVATLSTRAHALALKTDGSVVGWGLSRPGASHVPPEYRNHVLAIAAGGDFSLVVM